MKQIIDKCRLFLCFFSGEDDFIIKKCNIIIQKSFATIGLLVILIFAICWTSASLFMSFIFDGSNWISIPIGIFWGFIVTNLYLLLLYTFSPAILPVAIKKKVKVKGKQKKVVYKKDSLQRNTVYSFSFFSRISFLIFLGIIIIQPFNVLQFAASPTYANKFAFTLRTIMNENVQAWFNTFFCIMLFILPVFLKYRVRKISEDQFDKDFGGGKIGDELEYIRYEISNPSDYQRLVKYIQTIDINSIRTSDFYFQKTLIEYRIILDEYTAFKTSYCDLLKQNINIYNEQCRNKILNQFQGDYTINSKLKARITNQLDKDLMDEEIEFYEYSFDPPFRTGHKLSGNKPGTEAQLLENIYRTN